MVNHPPVTRRRAHAQNPPIDNLQNQDPNIIHPPVANLQKF